MSRKKSSARRQWKKVENRHAELHGGFRTTKAFPALRLGPYHGTNYPDWISDIVAGESKSGVDLIPEWIRNIVNQAIENEASFRSIDGKKRIPITILHQNKDNYNDDIVLIRDDVFREFVLPAIYALGQMMDMSWDPSKKT